LGEKNLCFADEKGVKVMKTGKVQAFFLLLVLGALMGALPGSGVQPMKASAPGGDAGTSRLVSDVASGQPIFLAANEGCSLKSYDLEKNPGMLPEQLKRKHCPQGCVQPWVGTAGDIDCDGNLEFAIAGDEDVGDFYHCTLYDDSASGFKPIPSAMWIGCALTILPERNKGYHNLRSEELKCGKRAPEDCRPVKCTYQWNGSKYVELSCGKK
jgi:hypothetical protein